MTEPETGATHEGRSSRAIAPRWRVVLSIVLVLMVLLLCLAGYLRPAARLGRLLTAVGAGRLPKSTKGLIIERQGRGLGIQRTYVRFSATPDDMPVS